MRAAPLPPEERREAILAAVLPLVLEHGHDLGTRQIAEASGIAEGTIYRVFPSKTELIDAAVRRALTPAHVLAALAALPADGDLAAVVTGCVGVLQEHARTTHRLIRLLRSADTPLAGRGPAARHEQGEQIMDAVARVLAPHAARLSIDPRAAAGALLALSFGSSLSPTPVSAPAVAGILLHGISRTEGSPCS